MLTEGNFVSLVLPLVCFLGGGKKQESPEEIHVDKHPTQLRTEVDTLDLWGSSTISYATMIPMNLIVTLRSFKNLSQKFTSILSQITHSSHLPFYVCLARMRLVIKKNVHIISLVCSTQWHFTNACESRQKHFSKTNLVNVPSDQIKRSGEVVELQVL